MNKKFDYSVIKWIAALIVCVALNTYTMITGIEIVNTFAVTLIEILVFFVICFKIESRKYK